MVVMGVPEAATDTEDPPATARVDDPGDAAEVAQLVVVVTVLLFAAKSIVFVEPVQTANAAGVVVPYT
jgi:hypothetical protein